MQEDESVRARIDQYALHSMAWLKGKRIVFVEGRGVILKDENGKEYIDACAGSNGPVLIGHSHPKYIKALRDQAEKLSHILPTFNSVPLAEFCAKMAQILPGDVNKSFVTGGGGEAMEVAIKLVMMQTRKSGFISLHYGYHGQSLGLMNLLGLSSLRDQYPNVRGPIAAQQIPNPYCYRCPLGLEYPDCDIACANLLDAAIKRGSSGDVAAFILEIVQGPGGMIDFPREYFARVKKICDENDVLIIADEIQTALGRCGKMFASELYGFVPDIVVTGKAFGGGYPIGVASFSDDLISEDVNEKSWHALTYQNSPLAGAVGSAVLDIAEEERFPERARTLGAYLKKGLEDLSKEHEIIGDVRGPGLFQGIELVKDRRTKEPAVEETRKIMETALDEGLITYWGGIGNVIKVKPPLVITEDQIDKILEILHSAFGRSS